MRCGIIVFALLTLQATPTFASPVKEPIPLDSWCYDSFEYLLAKGCLPTIYQAWFDQDKQLYYRDIRGLTTIVKQVTLMDRPKSISAEKWEFIRLLSQMLGNEFGHSLRYGSSYGKVSLDHWSYGAFDYLSRNDTLDGYPVGFFTSDRSLTRYEFAQATSRIMSSIDAEAEDENVIIIVEALKAEYREQLEVVTGKPVITIDYQNKF